MEDQTTEAAAVAEIARRATRVDLEVETLAYGSDVSPVRVTSKHTDEGVFTVDPEAVALTPRRPIAAVKVFDADSFVATVQRRALPDVDPTLYSDPDASKLTAILNDDTGNIAGWRDNRVDLGLNQTPERTLWTTADRTWLSQEQFAELIEEGARNITGLDGTPSAAAMLDLAQNVQATTTARFAGGTNLRTSDRVLSYTEETEATAGRDGSIQFPEVFQVGLRPFYGAVDRKPDDQPGWEPARFIVVAKLKFKVREGKLSLRIELDQPQDMWRHAWGLVAEQIAEELEIRPISGDAPAARVPGSLFNSGSR